MLVINSKNINGFTLLEMLIVITLMGILLSYAVPAYQGFMLRQKLSIEANDFVGDLNYARSEAINKGALIYVDSLNGSNWESGWVIYYTAPDGTRKDLRSKQKTSGKITISASASLGRIVYDSIGGLYSMPISFNIQNISKYPNFNTINVLSSGMITSMRSL